MALVHFMTYNLGTCVHTYVQVCVCMSLLKKELDFYYGMGAVWVICVLNFFMYKLYNYACLHVYIVCICIYVEGSIKKLSANILWSLRLNTIIS